MNSNMIAGRKGLLMAVFLNWILGWFGWTVFAQVQQDCDFRYYLNTNQQQVLQSPNFDQGWYYDPGKVCRWTYSSPVGTVIDVACNPIDIPNSNQCQQDRLVISQTGNPTLSDGRNFCGYIQARLTSVSNALTIGLISSQYSNGGRYRCIITALSTNSPTTAPPTTSTPKPNNCDCGWRQQIRIVGGQETKPNEYPFVAGVIHLIRKSIYCGASIISERYALTAAHCVVNQSVDTFGLLVGDHNLKFGNDTQSAALYSIQYFRIHENYDSYTQRNDIAIIRSIQAIYFSLNVGPVCLPYRYTDLDFTGAPVTALGWGSTSYSGPTSDTLQAVNLTVTSNGDCQYSYSPSVISTTQMCTTSTNNKDACQFDSGGPVIWFDNFNTFRYQLAGIISFGKGCASGTPAVNTRLPSYVSWILNQTPDAAYCFL